MDDGEREKFNPNDDYISNRGNLEETRTDGLNNAAGPDHMPWLQQREKEDGKAYIRTDETDKEDLSEANRQARAKLDEFIKEKYDNNISPIDPNAKTGELPQR